MKDNLKGVGIWGQRHYQYLKENRPTTISVMRMNGTLNSYLQEVDEQADEMAYQLVKQLAKQSGLYIRALLQRLYAQTESASCGSKQSLYLLSHTK